MPALLRQHYRAQGKPDYIATVHRLDKAVGGVMLFSRRREITGKLTAAIAEHRVAKEYLAVLRGTPEKDSDTLTDLLFRDEMCIRDSREFRGQQRLVQAAVAVHGPLGQRLDHRLGDGLPLVHRQPPLLAHQLPGLVGEVQNHLHRADDVLRAGEQHLLGGVHLVGAVGGQLALHRQPHRQNTRQLHQRQGDAVIGDGAVDAHRCV